MAEFKQCTLRFLLGYRIQRRNSMREISGSFSPLAPEFFSPQKLAGIKSAYLFAKVSIVYWRL